jgi:hypothetical protein
MQVGDRSGLVNWEELINRDKSLEESDNLPDPNVLAQEIVEDFESVLEQFRGIAVDLAAHEIEAEES